jgi:hypothetical protein
MTAVVKARQSSADALDNIFRNLSKNDIKLHEQDKTEIEEWNKCKNDFFHFLNYVGLDTVGNKEFNYHNGQELLIRTLMTDHKVVCLKSRQIGITTVIRAYAVWLALFNNDYTIGIISKLAMDASTFIRKCINIIDDLPPFLRRKFAKKTEQQFILDNGSSAVASCVSASQPENTLRSNPIAFLIIDEAAFVNKIKEAVSGLFPTTITIQKAAKASGIPYGVLVISTPNKTSGDGGWFFDMYKKALLNNGTNNDDPNVEEYKAVRLHWKDLRGVKIPNCPFDESYYNQMCATFNYQEDMIAQEVDCVFLPATKNGILTSNEIIEMGKHQIPPVNAIQTIGGEIQFFDDTISATKNNRRFVIGVDTATSNGHNTFSTVEVIDYDTNEQVCEYIGKLNVYDYPTVIRQICREFGPNIYIIAERNTIGETVVETFMRDPEFSSRMHKTLIKDPKTGLVTRQYGGLETNPKTKPLYLEAVTEFFKENLDKIHSEKTILQVTQTEIDGGRILTTPNDAIMVFAFISYCKKNNLIRFPGYHGAYNANTSINGNLGDMSEDEVLDYLFDRSSRAYDRVKLANSLRKTESWMDKLNDD